MDQLVSYPAAFVVWRPALAFSRETDWQYVVPEADQCAIADLIGAVPPGTFPLAPSYLIDGTSELAALWLLDEPLSLHAPADRARAEALQVRLSARLSADASAGALDAMLPLPGSAVRDVGQANTPPVVLLTCAPGRHYTLMQLEEATR